MLIPPWPDDLKSTISKLARILIGGKQIVCTRAEFGLQVGVMMVARALMQGIMHARDESYKVHAHEFLWVCKKSASVDANLNSMPPHPVQGERCRV